MVYNKAQKEMRKILFLLASITLFLACGKGEKTIVESPAEVTLKPNTTEVNGDLSGCFEVIDKEYKSNNGLLTFELKRTDTQLPFELKDGKSPSSYGTFGSDVYVHVGFGIEFLDKDGNILHVISATASGLGSCYSSDDPIALAKLKAGQSGIIRFSVPEAAKDAVSFRITTAYEMVEESSEKESKSSYSSSNSYDNELDRAIDTYEKALDVIDKANDIYKDL